MSDDSFFREVDEELRSERLRSFWDSWGRIIIGVAVVAIVALAAWRYWDYSTKRAAAEAGDTFMEAVRQAENGKSDEALATLAKLETSSQGSYASLARMRAAVEYASKDDKEAALAAYDEVIASAAADENLKAMARIRAGMLLVDTGSVADVQNRVEPLTAPGSPWRFSAREALGLAHYKASDLQSAYDQFNALLEDSETPQSMRRRVQIMLALIAADGGPTGDG